MTENIISIIFINPHFVNPKITKNPENSTFFLPAILFPASHDATLLLHLSDHRAHSLPPPPSARRKGTCLSFPQLIHTVRRTRTNTSSIFVLSTRYLVTVINIIHNLWITLWITFGFAVYNLWAFPNFPVFTPCITCIKVIQILHILIFHVVCPHFYQHRIPCYPQNIPDFINRKIFYTFCG